MVSSGEVIRIQFNLAQYGIMIGSFCGAYLGAIDLAWPWLAGGSALCSRVWPHYRYRSRPRLTTDPEPHGIYGGNSSAIFGRRQDKSRTDRSRSRVHGDFSTQALNMFWQPRFRDELALSVEHLGWLFVAMQVSVFVGNNMAKRYLRPGRSFSGLVTALSVFGMVRSGRHPICPGRSY